MLTYRPSASRFRRAGDQLKNLRSSIKEFLESNPYEIERQVDLDAERIFGVVRIRKEHPPMWSAIIGEIIHDLRCALDYLVFQLVIHETGSLPSIDSKIQCPIFETESGFNSRGAPTMLKNIGIDAIAPIKSEQPFAKGEGATALFGISINSPTGTSTARYVSLARARPRLPRKA